MNQAHFPDKILTLPIFKGRFDANKLTTENVDIYFASYPKNSAIEPHQHETDNYGIVTQGELILIVDGKEEYYPLGEWYHLKPDRVHAAKFLQDTSIIEFWFKE